MEILLSKFMTLSIESIKLKIRSLPTWLIVLLLVLCALSIRLITFDVFGLDSRIDYFNEDTLNNSRRSLIDGGGCIFDPLDYQEIAVNIIKGNGYSRNSGKPTAFRAPGYPFFLSLIFYLFGFSSYIAVLMNILLSSITVIPLYLVALNIFSSRVAVMSGLLNTLYPLSVFWSINIIVEPLFVFLLVTALWFFVKTIYFKNNMIYHSLFFLFLVLASFIKPYLFLFVLLYVFVNIIKRNLNRCKIIGILLYLIIFSVWPIRNYITLGAFSMGTNSGFNFWIGSAGKIEHGFKFDSESAYKFEEELLGYCDDPQNEIFVQSMFYQKAFEKIQEKPIDYIKVVGFKILWMCKFWTQRSNYELFLYILCFLITYLPATLSIIIKPMRYYLFQLENIEKLLIFYIGIIIVLIVISIVFWPIGRFRYPIDILIIPLSSFGIYSIIDSIKAFLFSLNK